MTKRTLFLLAVTTVFLLTVSDTAQAQAAVTTHSGSLADGAKYLIDVPANWNRTLFLYSHGYVTPGTPNPPQDFAKDDLDADLDTLNDTARISADPEVVRYPERNIIINGEIHLPVLTPHTKGDGLVVVENESAYKEVVDEAGKPAIPPRHVSRPRGTLCLHPGGDDRRSSDAHQPPGYGKMAKRRCH